MQCGHGPYYGIIESAAGRLELEIMDNYVDKGSEWILSVARHRDPLADPVGMLRHAEIDLD